MPHCHDAKLLFSYTLQSTFYMYKNSSDRGGTIQTELESRANFDHHWGRLEIYA